jgi:hypothetical protein
VRLRRSCLPGELPEEAPISTKVFRIEMSWRSGAAGGAPEEEALEPPKERKGRGLRCRGHVQRVRSKRQRPQTSSASSPAGKAGWVTALTISMVKHTGWSHGPRQAVTPSVSRVHKSRWTWKSTKKAVAQSVAHICWGPLPWTKAP